MPVWYLYHSFQNSVFSLYGHVTWTFFSKSLGYSEALRRRYIRKTEMEEKKNQREGTQQFVFLATPLFVASFFHAFVKTGRPSGPQTTLSHSHPAAPYSQKGFFLASFCWDFRTLERFGKERRDHFFFFGSYFVPGAPLGNLAVIILFNAHRNFYRQVYSHFINEETTAHRAV